MKKMRTLVCIFIAIMAFLPKTAYAIVPEKYIKLSDEALAYARYSKVIELSSKFLNEYINTSHCSSTILTRHMSNLRKAYKEVGDTKGYENFCSEIFNKVSPDRGSTLIRLFILISLDCKGSYAENSMDQHSFSHFGNNDFGLHFYDRNYSALPKDILDKNPVVRAWLHLIRADILAYSEQYEEAADEISKAQKIIVSNSDATDPVHILPALATEILLAQQGLWSEATQHAMVNKTAIERLGTENKEYYALLARLAYYSYKNGDFEAAAHYAKLGDIRPSVFDKLPSLINYRNLQGGEQENSISNIFKNPNFNLNWIVTANSLFAISDIEAATQKASKLLYSLQKDIAENYSKFAFNRAGNDLKSKVNTLVNSSASFALKNPKDSTLQGISYNAGLIYKQLTLSSYNFFRNIAAKLGNPVLVERIKELEQSKKQLDNIDPSLTDSLIQRISQLESNLDRNLHTRSDVSLTSLPNWTNIQKVLMPNTAAIEFFIARTDSGDVYTASILRPNSSFPQIINLGKANIVNNIHKPLSTTKLYSLLWQPLMDELKDISTIYFSPIGQLNLIPIEYAPIDDLKKINDRFMMFRLSSTQELLYKPNSDTENNILLYGGIKYNLEPEEIVSKNNEINDKIKDIDDYNLNLEESSINSLRAGIAYLPATLEEVNNIAKLYQSHGLNATVLTGSKASELSVKNLNGEKVSILHIATHGFALNEKSRSRLGRLLTSKQRFSVSEEKTLSHSGLMLAGAANSINNKSSFSSSSKDDGILTALELSRLDLSGIEMVVLSACESGKGEILTEGIAGLQRGFKIAGVHSLIVSLWKVDDEATSILMTEFYKNRLNGNPPTIALRNAQDYLKSFEEGKYNDPEYWGAFIIVDTI